METESEKKNEKLLARLNKKKIWNLVLVILRMLVVGGGGGGSGRLV